MQQKIKSGRSTIKDFFASGVVLSVPIYQRAYTWTQKNLEELISDLTQQRDSQKYFFGAFLLHDKAQTGLKLDIVDGQQRLTTLTILMCCICATLADKGEHILSKQLYSFYIKSGGSYKFHIGSDNTEFFYSFILSDGIINIDNLSTSQKRLYEAKDYFSQYLGKISLTELKQILKIVELSDILLYTVSELESATQIFELLNDRGVPLSKLESIKSFLMHTLGASVKNSDHTLVRINSKFAKIYRLIEDNDIAERDVLRYHTLAFELSDEDPKKVIKEKISKVLFAKNEEYLSDFIIDYIERLVTTFDAYAQINKLRFEQPEVADLFMIGRFGSYYPIILKTFITDNDNFLRLVKGLAIFTFKANLGNLRSNAGVSYVETRLRNNESTESIIGLIEDYVESNWWDINGRASEGLSSKDFYNRFHALSKYILTSYENSLRIKYKAPPIGCLDYESKDSKFLLTIEHVTAQRNSKTSESKTFQEGYLHSLGNLVIDWKGANSSKGKHDFVEKNKSYKYAPMVAPRLLEEIDCDWQSIISIQNLIKIRDEEVKAFIRKKFAID